MAVADVTQTTAASQPLLLAHSGVNYWWGSGVSGNYCSSPITISSPYSNDFEIQINVQNSDISGTYYYQTVFSVGQNFSLGIGFYDNNIFVLQNGNATVQTTVGISSSIDGYYKVTKETLTYSFYSSNDGINWTLIERVNNANMSFVFTGSNMCVGGYNNATDTRGNWRGKIRRIKLWIDGLSNTGTLSFDFNPSEYSASSSQTNWNSSTGEVWTINTGTVSTGYKGVLVDRTTMQADGIDDGMQTSGTISLSSAFTIYGAFKGYNNEGGSGKSAFGKYNIDGALTRFTSSQLGVWIGNGGAALVTQNATVTNLNLVTFKRKVSDNVMQVNNGASVTNTNSATIINSSIFIFYWAGGSSNSLFTTGLFSDNEDTTGQKTALYNITRSMNNNAF